MDPNTTLVTIRELVDLSKERLLTLSEVRILIENVENMDEWLSNGGFVPQDWVRTV